MTYRKAAPSQPRAMPTRTVAEDLVDDVLSVNGRFGLHVTGLEQQNEECSWSSLQDMLHI